MCLPMTKRVALGPVNKLVDVKANDKAGLFQSSVKAAGWGPSSCWGGQGLDPKSLMPRGALGHPHAEIISK